jgi:maltose alpha-D-glucosyltransferase/alpha-amylase
VLQQQQLPQQQQQLQQTQPQPQQPPQPRTAPLTEETAWYKDAVIYELHVRAFNDGNGDGIGDFIGLTQKLDYLQDLGITAIWLLPFYPSPLKDDGYDIADYTAIHPSYGTLRDFRTFLEEAHSRGIRVITELVINHTSDQHPWFQRARRARHGSQWRNFYVWSDTPDRYKDARIIFKDFELSNWTWDPVAGAYYWHRFYSHQPDLNFDSPAVRRAVFRIMDFWFKMGVDGVRLDAVPYLFEREGTNCENLPETHAFLKAIRRHVNENYPDRMLLAEANQWPEDAVAYFGGGDECHMAFHFPLMPRLFMATQMEDRFPIIDILQQTPSIPDTAQWALFLRNHDELTLEMVTDEERDYMNRFYAQDAKMRINVGIRRRLAPLLGNDRRKIELMNGLLFSMPGTPVLYYGDEIGMGDNFYLGDRNGVRTPMQWSGDRNGGFSRANPQRLYLPVIIDPEYHYEAVNVEAHQNNSSSLLWWMKHLISLRKRLNVFGHGSLEFLFPENRKVLAFIRKDGGSPVLVVANLSRFTQVVELDLSAYQGCLPIEIFGRTQFPRVTDQPYLLTLGPHMFHWFALEPAPSAQPATPVPLPTLIVRGEWSSVFRPDVWTALEPVLLSYIRGKRWFGGKARTIHSTQVLDVVEVGNGHGPAYFVLTRIGYTEGEPDTYMLPLAFASGDEAQKIGESTPQFVVASIALGQGRRADAAPMGILYEALASKDIMMFLLDAITKRRRFRGEIGEITAVPTRSFREVRGADSTPLEPNILRGEQTNTSVTYGERLIMKLFRRLESGLNPDLEIGRHLTDKTDFVYVPQVAGALEYRRAGSEPVTAAILQGFVPNQGDAWRYTLDHLGSFYANALASRPDALDACKPPARPLLELAESEVPLAVAETIGPYLTSARLLGQRTAELHLALAQDVEDPAFTPEPFTQIYQRSLNHSMVSEANDVFRLLRRSIQRLPEPLRPDVQAVLDRESPIRDRFQALRARRIDAFRIRCHGDYHLGQVLYTGRDFVIIDFEGEPARPLSERRIKRSPLRDVAGMLRSFHYASYAALAGEHPGEVIRPEDYAALEPWAHVWCVWVSVAFLQAYLETAGKGTFLPRTREERQILLDAFLLEKAIYEISYEMNNRPSWLRIPLRGILTLIPAPPDSKPTVQPQVNSQRNEVVSG